MLLIPASVHLYTDKLVDDLLWTNLQFSSEVWTYISYTILNIGPDKIFVYLWYYIRYTLFILWLYPSELVWGKWVHFPVRCRMADRLTFQKLFLGSETFGGFGGDWKICRTCSPVNICIATGYSWCTHFAWTSNMSVNSSLCTLTYTWTNLWMIWEHPYYDQWENQ